MRLLGTETLQLRDFGSQPPPYAILSHTWGRDKVTFEDMVDLEQAREKKKSGFKKLDEFCKQADTDGFQWVWIDTCCI